MKTLFGCLLILFGGFCTGRELCFYRRREQTALRDMAVALEYLAHEIAYKQLPMTRLLTMSGMGRYGDMFFLRVRNAMKSGSTLADAWKKTAEELPLFDREREEIALLGTQFSREKAVLCKSLQQVAEILKKHEKEVEESRRRRERLITASCFSCSILLCVLLL